MSDSDAGLIYRPWDDPSRNPAKCGSYSRRVAEGRADMAKAAAVAENTPKRCDGIPDITPPLLNNPYIQRFMVDDVTIAPPEDGAVDSDRDRAVVVIQDLTEKVEGYCQRLRSGVPDGGSATSDHDSLQPYLTQMVLQEFPSGPTLGDGVLPPNVPEGAEYVIKLTRRALATGDGPTYNEALGALDGTDQWVSDAAKRGFVAPVCAIEAQMQLDAARSDASNGQLTTSDIMGLIAEVLARAATNANEMRLEESKASMSGIDQSLEEAKHAASLKIESAKEQREATELLAKGEMIAGGLDIIGGIGSAFGGAFSQAVGQAIGQTLAAAGKIVEGHFRLEAASHQYAAAMHQAEADLLQSYSQQSGTMAQRSQSSAQDQGQAVQTALKALTDLINQLNQTTMGIAQNFGR